MAAIAMAAAVLPVGISFAQTSPGASDLLAAVDYLETVDAARQSVLGQVGLQLTQIAEEAQNLPREPMSTPDERAAFAAELGLVTAKLGGLSATVDILDQIQATENSLFAAMQAQMQALGI
jgi:hypothetical protein